MPVVNEENGSCVVCNKCVQRQRVVKGHLHRLITQLAPHRPHHPALHSGSEGGDDGARKMYCTRHKTLSAIITHRTTCATTMYHQFYSRVSFASLLKSHFGHLYLKKKLHKIIPSFHSAVSLQRNQITKEKR